MKKYFKGYDHIFVYMVILITYVIALFTQDFRLGIIALLAYIAIFIYSIFKMRSMEKEKYQYVENVTGKLKNLAENVVFNMPFPLVVLSGENKIIWYNTHFRDFSVEKNLSGMNLEMVLPKLSAEVTREIDSKEGYPLSIGEDDYRIFGTVLDKHGEQTTLLYFIDESEYRDLLAQYDREQVTIGLLEIDNYAEIMDSADSATKPILIGRMDHAIHGYFNRWGALVRKFGTDEYLLILNNEDLQELRRNRFSILDEIRGIEEGNTIAPTLSIGVSRPNSNFLEAFEEADNCRDVALARGGDQAVIIQDDNYEYFGGKSQAQEKRNKVKARVLGLGIKQAIERAERIYVMGHGNPDMDAIGASIGMLAVVRNLGKKGHIVFNESNPSIKRIMNRMEQEEKDIYRSLISGSDAEEQIRSSDLLIVVDTHKPSLTIEPGLVEKANNIIVIDHHRRGKEFIENPLITYVEPYASSTSELISEMMPYMIDAQDLTQFEADALMSGIIVDTKNFSYRTGVRTFEAASQLRRAGADTERVQKLFQDDFETITSRAEAIHKSRIIEGEVAISRVEDDNNNVVLVSAQAADELLQIHGVKASFVLGQIGNIIHISGRSQGDISVQLILEKLGGGGHLDMAGAQLKDRTLEEAETLLVEAIQEYFEEEGEKR